MPGTLIYLSNCAISADGRQNPFMMQELPWLMAHFDRVMMVSYYGVRTLMPGDERGERPLASPSGDFARHDPDALSLIHI